MKSAKPRPRRALAKRETARHYRALQRAYGRQHWWPANSRFEVVLGAFLTQNTSWRNVELALANLRSARALSLNAIRRMREQELAKLIRPAGYFRQKAKRIKNFVAHLDAAHAGSLKRMLGDGSSADALAAAREHLLALNGIGRETADSILLYAGHQPIFVVDAYTRRVLERHRLIQPGADYDEIRALVEESFAGRSLPDSPEKNLGHRTSRMSRAKRSDLAQHYNEFHGLLVQLGKRHCHKRAPICSGCPLEKFLPKKGVARG
ncbi:MAG TPA: base excision DNA repair protein [Terriglobales bacterium]|nr:base excision DNA repair protein [Terriglobales bacterium]